jgi:hypothetical protein
LTKPRRPGNPIPETLFAPFVAVGFPLFPIRGPQIQLFGSLPDAFHGLPRCFSIIERAIGHSPRNTLAAPRDHHLFATFDKIKKRSKRVFASNAPTVFITALS